MSDFEKMLRGMFSSIWDCEINHPLWQDTVGEIMTAVIQTHEKCMPEPCEDAVSRQAAIDTLNVGTELLRRVLDDADVIGAERAKYEWGLGLIESYISDIKELPSAQPEPPWIPVSERLPEKDGKYMVTIHGYGWNGKTFTSVSVAECIGKRWVGNNGVIAWMPLPKIYKPNK